jgi:hypothetical protein
MFLYDASAQKRWRNNVRNKLHFFIFRLIEKMKKIFLLQFAVRNV